MATPATPPTPPPMQPLTEMKLPGEIREAVNKALEEGAPVIVAYVDEEGQPSLSFRGSTHVHSDTQLGIWVRNPEGGLLRSLEKNPRVSLLYRSREKRMTLQFRGRAHVETDDAVRDHMYDIIPQVERNADAQKRGIALIIDLDRVDGFMPGFRVQMRR